MLDSEGSSSVFHLQHSKVSIIRMFIVIALLPQIILIRNSHKYKSKEVGAELGHI